jgi:ferredoxin--NADP+ reductase
MYKIITKKRLAKDIYLTEVEAPRIARAALPGQFVIVRAGEKSERIPLTICDYHAGKGTITLVTQIVGASSRQICAKNEGEYLLDVAGPLGCPSEFVHKTREELQKLHLLFVAGGLGTAPVYPQVKWLHEQGARVEVIIGAKTADMLILENEMQAVCHAVHIATDDGSKGNRGLVTDVIKKLTAMPDKKYDTIIAIGPMIMMKFVALLAQDCHIPVIVSLNTLMVDGTGMCGACRVTIGGKTKFTCVDGPEFDGALVDFDEAMRRQTMYKQAEMDAEHKCKIGLNQ